MKMEFWERLGRMARLTVKAADGAAEVEQAAMLAPPGAEQPGLAAEQPQARRPPSVSAARRGKGAQLSHALARVGACIPDLKLASSPQRTLARIMRETAPLFT